MEKSVYCQYFKTIFDFTAAFILFVLLLPLMFIIGLLVKIFIGSPIIFKQLRPGLHGKPFYLYKFRTMQDTYDGQGNLLSDGQRLMWFGKLLRSLSLDELPELINILKGEMSLVGPRPLLMEYLKHYTKKQHTRHNVKPGITGWAQVNGRNTLSWNKKFELDIWYVEHISFSLDVKILFLTLIKTVKREGIHADGEATMTRFDGRN